MVDKSSPASSEPNTLLPVILKKSHHRHLRVHVTVLGDKRQQEILVRCGNGRQTVKWLALVVMSRLSTHKTAKNQSDCRSRVPGEILLRDTLIDPCERIKDVFRDGDRCEMKLANNQVARYTCGIPELYMSPWSQRAFYPQQTKSLKQTRALQTRKAYLVDRAVTQTRYENDDKREPEKQKTEDDILVSNFKALMVNQNSLENCSETTELAVDQM